MTPVTLEAVDAELAQWRQRLAAASRNVSELSELPEYSAVRVLTEGAGRLAEEARGVKATMDELWQGVLLIGAALDRAEQARKGGSRLWRGDEAAAEAMAVLRGPSITVDLVETPVLHRRLLGGARASATVTPDMLLMTMDAAFDRVRASLGRITEATGRAAALQARLAAAAARAPGQGFEARLLAACAPDPLDRLEALEALASDVDAGVASAERANAALEAAQAAASALRGSADQALAASAACRAAVAGPLPAIDEAALQELGAWLERLRRTLEAGRVEAYGMGLANWQALHARVKAEIQALAQAAGSGLARRDELVARLGAYRAKHRARSVSGLEALAAAATAAVGAVPMELAAAGRALADYEAALGRV